MVCTMHVKCYVWGGWVFFFNDTAPTEIYTRSLHDALPISVFDGWLYFETGVEGEEGEREKLKGGKLAPVSVRQVPV